MSWGRGGARGEGREVGWQEEEEEEEKEKEEEEENLPRNHGFH